MTLFFLAALGVEACFLTIMFGSEQMRGKPGIQGGMWAGGASTLLQAVRLMGLKCFANA